MWYLCRLSSINIWIKNHHSIPVTKKVVVPLIRRKVAAGVAATVKNHLKEMGLVMIHAAATVHAKTTADKGAEMADTRKKTRTVSLQEDLTEAIDLVKVILAKATDRHAHHMAAKTLMVAPQTVNRITQIVEAILAEIINAHLANAQTDQKALGINHLIENQELTAHQANHMAQETIADHPAEKTPTDLMEKVKVVNANHIAAPKLKAMLVEKVDTNARIRTEVSAVMRAMVQEKNSENHITKTKSVGVQKKDLMLMARTNLCQVPKEKHRQTTIRKKRNLILKPKTDIWKMTVMTGK